MKVTERRNHHLDLTKSFSVADYFINDQYFLRIFNDEIDGSHFVWHRDEKRRTAKIVYSDENWLLQFDNFLPFTLSAGMEININENTYHKLHKGSGTLIILIKEY